MIIRTRPSSVTSDVTQCYRQLFLTKNFCQNIFKTTSWPSLLTLILHRFRFTLPLRYASMCRYRLRSMWLNQLSEAGEWRLEDHTSGTLLYLGVRSEDEQMRRHCEPHANEKKKHSAICLLFIKRFFFLYFSTRSPRGFFLLLISQQKLLCETFQWEPFGELVFVAFI